MSLAAWNYSTHWAFSTEREQESRLRHPSLGDLPFSVCPSAQSEDIKNQKGHVTRPTLCMAKLQSQEGIDLLSSGAQADSEHQPSHQCPEPWTCCRPLWWPEG